MSATLSDSTQEPSLTFKGFAVLAAIVLIGAWAFWPRSAAFNQKDIDKIKADIRTEFSKREGLKVVDVQMIRESDRKLVGFVKLEIEALAELKGLGGLFDGTMMKECTASMGEDWQILWSCR